MDGSLVREHITEELLLKLQQARYPHVPLMSRIEARIRTRDELERYVEILVAKFQATEFRSETLLDRIDRMTALLEHLGERQAANVRVEPVSSVRARSAS